MVGAFVNEDRGGGTDVDALEEGYASIVPIKFDLTDNALKTKLEQDWKDVVA
jgi:5'-nucleotidase